MSGQITPHAIGNVIEFEWSESGAKMPDKPITTQQPDDGLQPLVTELTPITEQVGNHVLTALQEEECVAVLTTLVGGYPTDKVVSVALNAEQMANVGEILGEVQKEPEDADEEAICIGFHCHIPKENKKRSK